MTRPDYRTLRLGDAFPPGREHSICCHLPRLDDVRGYEEKRAETMAAIRQGYPRFVRHQRIDEARRRIAEDLGLAADGIGLVGSERLAREAAAYAGEAAAVVSGRPDDGLFVVAAPTPSSAKRLQAFLQHTGAQVSSRQAVAWLAGEPEPADPERDAAHVRAVLGRLLGVAPDGPPIELMSTGMGAFYAAFRAVQAVRAPARRWIQLGWLYLDTQKVLQELSGLEPIRFADVNDTDAVVARIRAEADTLAGIVCEAPTNPLVQTPDLATIAAVCRETGVPLIIDPTVACCANVDVLPLADLVTTSLTKYAVPAADAMLGAVAVRADGRYAAALAAALPEYRIDPYPADLAVVARSVGAMAENTHRINARTRRVAQWLEDDDRVDRVFHAEMPAERNRFATIRRSDGGPGAVITLFLRGEMERFYDALPLIKCPSFGAGFTMACPFMYLAHYDLVTRPEGRRELRAAGIDPNLIRLSVGMEDPDEIIAALDEGLAAMKR